MVSEGNKDEQVESKSECGETEKGEASNEYTKHKKAEQTTGEAERS